MILLTVGLAAACGLQPRAALPTESVLAESQPVSVQPSETLIQTQPPDLVPPVIEGVQSLCVYMGTEMDLLAGVIIRDDRDAAPILTLDDKNVDWTRPGEYEIVYLGRDASGNETRETAVLTLVDDHIPPTILGVNPISLYAGGTVAYRSGILVTDDQDGAPKLTVDSSGVDLSAPGVYELIYRAVDEAGNEAAVATTVTVLEKSAGYVDEETIYAEADAILEKIITVDMTVRDQVEAIYRWMKRNLTYTGNSDKTDRLQAAYVTMTRRTGDCFSYYAVGKLMFDRLGIPNITVLRSADSVRAGSHYWSLVSVDGGETYYHVDATPRSLDYTGDRNFCLVTDGFLDDYDRSFPGYYTRDRSLYPATPEE